MEDQEMTRQEKREILRKLARNGDRVVINYSRKSKTRGVDISSKQDILGFRENFTNMGFGFYLRRQGNKIPINGVTSVLYSPIEDVFHINMNWDYIYAHRSDRDMVPRGEQNISQVMEAIGWQH